jgi:hypothetical protein
MNACQCGEEVSNGEESEESCEKEKTLKDFFVLCSKARIFLFGLFLFRNPAIFRIKGNEEPFPVFSRLFFACFGTIKKPA